MPVVPHMARPLTTKHCHCLHSQDTKEREREGKDSCLASTMKKYANKAMIREDQAERLHCARQRQKTKSGEDVMGLVSLGEVNGGDQSIVIKLVKRQEDFPSCGLDFSGIKLMQKHFLLHHVYAQGNTILKTRKGWFKRIWKCILDTQFSMHTELQYSVCMLNAYFLVKSWRTSSFEVNHKRLLEFYLDVF